jgi:hypothetical protein
MRFDSVYREATIRVRLQSCATIRQLCAICGNHTPKYCAQVFILDERGELQGVICPDQCLPALHAVLPGMPSPIDWRRLHDAVDTWDAFGDTTRPSA